MNGVWRLFEEGDKIKKLEVIANKYDNEALDNGSIYIKPFEFETNNVINKNNIRK